ncbi:MAG: hypothetical protein KF889_11780 [Alphaproteobacteria bacterium]|nr:hypothetical protein [Alphaproteobacteria bacterium]MCW5739330.1 hypothetical protein [Alphaproteobacteria bacterium]
MGVALTVLRRRDAAEDVLQEAFVAIWDKAGQYRPERGAPMAWMAMVVRRRAVDRLRRAARRSRSCWSTGSGASARSCCGWRPAATCRRTIIRRPRNAWCCRATW